MEPDEVVENRVAAVVIMAAGAGTRMKSAKPKVLHPIAGKSMVGLAIDTADALAPDRLVVVVGHQREQVTAHLAEIAPHVTIAVQERALGTGDAVRAGLAALPGISGEVVVTSGDVPLLSGQTLIDLVSAHRAGGNDVTVLTAVVPDATGYGRIVRDGNEVARIVEHADATDAELDLTEINSGIYVFDAATLTEGLAALEAKNAQGELYLTDVRRPCPSLGTQGRRPDHRRLPADRRCQRPCPVGRPQRRTQPAHPRALDGRRRDGAGPGEHLGARRRRPRRGRDPAARDVPGRCDLRGPGRHHRPRHHAARLSRWGRMRG